MHGEVNKDFKTDLAQRDDCILLQLMLNEAENKPNSRQQAFAQFVVGKLYSTQRQLCVVPSGQGKSRITATAAAIALTLDMFSKVHLVFENKHLMERDQQDFEDYWILLSCDESKIEYHVGLDFQPAANELIIVDEADTFIFNETDRFTALIAESACLCYTATPDNCDPKGVEKKMVSALGFQKYNYILDEQMKKPSLDIDEVVTGKSLTEKAAYINERAKIGPVLVRCTADLTAELEK